jgi:hypothetical protein
MITKDEALKMAIEALEEAREQIGGLPQLEKLIQDCKEALGNLEKDYSFSRNLSDKDNKFADKLEIENCDLKQLAQEPFGYFKAEPFGWTDCGKDNEGAIALYEKPQV